MFSLAITFFLIAVVAAIFGFSGIVSIAAGVAKVCFFVFLTMAALSFLFHRRSK